MRRIYNLFFIALIILTPGGKMAHAAAIDDLQLKISAKSDEIKNLEAQIAGLNKNIEETQGAKLTLSAELRQIDAVNKKLLSDIKVTSKKIDLANLNISGLERQVQNENQKISQGFSAISGSLNALHRLDSTSLIENVLSDTDLSNTWNQISYLTDFQSKVSAHVKELDAIKNGLEQDQKKLMAEKNKLIILKSQLSDQQKIEAQNLADKNRLIKETDNKEANFKKLLADTEARKVAVEDELLSYESELKATVNPNLLPSIGTHVLSWPLDLVSITQYFGQTAFAMSHAVYNGKGHNGIDLRASIGTPVRAALSGTVSGAGDTDPVCYGASYGRWIMIDHHNGLVTIYGHLSLIKVLTGEEVGTGDIIGYSGKTGYATGPHLHFTVAATQAVKIGNLKSKVKGCGTYTIPLGPFNGYLNPLLYL